MAAGLTFETFPSPLGPFTVVSGQSGVVATTTDDPQALLQELSASLRCTVEPNERRRSRAAAELREYFAGSRESFDTPLDLRLASTPFGRRVLEVTTQIPYGQMWTYGDVAAMAGRPGAARAAGGALRRCPIEIFVPCHRVVPAGPGLGSYGGDDDRRAFLLRLEGAI